MLNSSTGTSWIRTSVRSSGRPWCGSFGGGSPTVEVVWLMAQAGHYTIPLLATLHRQNCCPL